LQLSFSDIIAGIPDGAPDRGGRFRALAGAVVVDQEGRVLLLHRAAPPQWELPGGKVERGESRETAAVRELWEELGILVANLDPIGDARFRQHDRGWSYSWFVAKFVVGEPSIGEPDRFDGLAYWQLTDLTRMMTELSPNLRLLVRAYFDGKLILPEPAVGASRSA
jgi:8-oxo-dGTP pyrophosphatase MutT (NUDIX family)